MSSFDFLWQMLNEHGVIERYKGDCLDLWNTFSLEQQRLIYRSIRDKIRAGKFVNYHPVKAVRDNIPTPPMKKLQTLSFNDYYARYGTTEETDGWERQFLPEQQKTIYVKKGTS